MPWLVTGELSKCELYNFILFGSKKTSANSDFFMPFNLVLPGQPIPIPRGPRPQLGSGVYFRDGHTRASLVGIPRYEGSVGGVLFMINVPLVNIY